MSANASPWTDSAAALLKQWLEGDLGQLFLAHVTSARPGLLMGSNDINATALRGAEAAGFESCVNRIFSLAVPPAKETTVPNGYPDPEDDAHWNDGKKLNEKPK